MERKKRNFDDAPPGLERRTVFMTDDCWKAIHDYASDKELKIWQVIEKAITELLRRDTIVR